MAAEQKLGSQQRAIGGAHEQDIVTGHVIAPCCVAWICGVSAKIADEKANGE
jgi:hypothetical protein